MNNKNRIKLKMRLRKAREAKEKEETHIEEAEGSKQSNHNHIEFNGIHVKPTPSSSTKFKKNKLMEMNVIPAHPFSMSILGGTGSGKTHLLSFVLNNKSFYKNTFDRIYVFGRTIEADHTWKYISRILYMAKTLLNIWTNSLISSETKQTILISHLTAATTCWWYWRTLAANESC